jgi:HEPN domain-containing protein
MPDRFPPDSPEEWMNRARSSLALAKNASPDIYFEDLCYQAQQAGEKAIKAIFISEKITFPYIHDITALLTRLEHGGITVPGEIRKAAVLSIYASQTRYPGIEPPLTEEEYKNAICTAESVIVWAEKIIKSG